MSGSPIGRPDPSEYNPYFGRYIDLVHGDVIDALSTQIRGSLETLRRISGEDSRRRYAPDKWNIREIVGHLIDTERVFASRALWFARGGPGELPGMEQDDFAGAARSDDREWNDLLFELELLRRADVLMFRGLDREAWSRRGVASGSPISVRALAFNIAGHELHHMKVIRERYLPVLSLSPSAGRGSAKGFPLA